MSTLAPSCRAPRFRSKRLAPHPCAPPSARRWMPPECAGAGAEEFEVQRGFRFSKWQPAALEGRAEPEPLVPPDAAGRALWGCTVLVRARSHRCVALPLVHCIPDSLTYSVTSLSDPTTRPETPAARPAARRAVRAAAAGAAGGQRAVVGLERQEPAGAAPAQPRKRAPLAMLG
jgi:hypothetical protein